MKIVSKENRNYYFIGYKDKPNKHSPKCDFILLNKKELETVKNYYIKNIKWLESIDPNLALSWLCQDLIPIEKSFLAHNNFEYTGCGVLNEFCDYETEYLFSYMFRVLVKIRRSRNYLISSEPKSEYIKFLLSDYWKDVRKLVINRDIKCVKCNSFSNLQVHHLTYVHHYNEHNHLNDLITLCRECHKKEHKII